MSTASQHARYSLGEYLELESFANTKHEFLGGQILAMAGGTPEHGAMAVRVAASLVAQLHGRRCNVYNSDVRVRIPATGLVTYPDLSVVCGAVERDRDDRQALTNPVLLVEVLSPSTEEYDRGDKLEHYKQLESVREVVLVAHDRPAIEVWRRDAKGWRCQPHGTGEVAELSSIRCRLVVDELFTDPLAG